MDRRIRKIVGALCLLALFASYQVSLFAFTHVHYVNGVLVAHSHPFHGTHSHSRSAMAVIAHLSAYLSLAADECGDLSPFCALAGVLLVEPEVCLPLQYAVRMYSLRAPPSMC